MINDETRAQYQAPTDLALLFLGALNGAYRDHDMGAFASAWSLCDSEFQGRWSKACIGSETIGLDVMVNRMVNHLVLQFPPIQRCAASAHQEPETVDLVLVRIHDTDLVDMVNEVTTDRSHAAAVPMMMRWDGTGWLVNDVGWNFVRPDGC